MTTYSEKLKDVRWQKMRLKVLERDKFMCQCCYATEERAIEKGETLTLHVHHTYYKRGANPWNYPEGSLVTLCADCHEREGAASHEETERLLIKAFRNWGYLNQQMRTLAQFMNSLDRSSRPIDLNVAIGECLKNSRVVEMFMCLQILGEPDRAKEIFDEIWKEERESWEMTRNSGPAPEELEALQQ